MEILNTRLLFHQLVQSLEVQDSSALSSNTHRLYCAQTQTLALLIRSSSPEVCQNIITAIPNVIVYLSKAMNDLRFLGAATDCALALGYIIEVSPEALPLLELNQAVQRFVHYITPYTGSNRYHAVTAVAVLLEHGFEIRFDEPSQLNTVCNILFNELEHPSLKVRSSSLVALVILIKKNYLYWFQNLREKISADKLFKKIVILFPVAEPLVIARAIIALTTLLRVGNGRNFPRLKLMIL